jgi:hypothetical protein
MTPQLFQVALEAGCPIIPMFTENCRETFRIPSFTRGLLRRIYERTRLPIGVIYFGGLPVKMRLARLDYAALIKYGGPEMDFFLL